ncbi:MAG: glycosyltransferase family 2 protein [Actinomycetota bacterium]
MINGDDLQLSVVVPTRDRPDMLRRCLDSIVKSLRAGDELIVVDSASRGAGAAAIAAEHGARLITAEAPGVSLARNLGWRVANHPVVAFVDDDIVVAPDWADAIRATFAGAARLGFVTGRVVPPAHQTGAEHPIALVDAPEPLEHEPRAPRHEGISGNFAVRRQAMEKVDGFDESMGPGGHFKGGCEDFDLFDRLVSSSASGRYEPSIIANHDQWRSKRERLATEHLYGVGSGVRLAKLVRTDRAHARRVAREIFWRWGLKDLGTSIRKRYEYGALAAILRLAGMVRGLLTGLANPVVNGHFAPRRRA